MALFISPQITGRAGGRAGGRLPAGKARGGPGRATGEGGPQSFLGGLRAPRRYQAGRVLPSRGERSRAWGGRGREGGSAAAPRRPRPPPRLTCSPPPRGRGGGAGGGGVPAQGPPPRPAAISRDYPKHLPVAARLPPGIGGAACQSGRRPAAPGLRRATETSRGGGGGRHSPGAGPRRGGAGGWRRGGWRRRCSRRRKAPAPLKSTSSGAPTAS